MVIVMHMTANLRNLPGRLACVLAALVVTIALIGVQAQSAHALGSGKFPWRGDDSHRTLYYYYGSGGLDGGLAYATTTATGKGCLLYVKRVKTKIRLPNGSYASHSSLLGQCSSGVDISHGGYSVFEIKSTHTLQKWSGTEYNYVL